MRQSAFLIVVLGIILSGCGTGPTGLQGATGTLGKDGAAGVNGLNGVEGHSALLKSVAIPLGNAECGGYGGWTILGGTDWNDDGKLEDSEVAFSSVVCNGAPGKSGKGH